MNKTTRYFQLVECDWCEDERYEDTEVELDDWNTCERCLDEADETYSEMETEYRYLTR